MNTATQAKLFNNFLAIGVGLIGGSACLDVRAKGLAKRIFAYSRRLETTHEALTLGIVDECITGADDAVLKSIDAVLISVPVQQYEAVLRRFLPVLPANCLLFDAGSTKGDVAHTVSLLEKDFPGLSARFIPSHPIAGGESHGPRAAVTGLFENRNCVICPLENSGSDYFKKVKEFWERVGAKVSLMEARAHDNMFGAVSHLPHWLAFVYVAALLQRPDGIELMQEGGAGFRDFTRIAASSPEMWADIFQNNKSVLIEMLGQFEATLTQARQALEQGNREDLEGLLVQASEFRKRWKQL